jgi:hypothetical protein
MLRNLKAISRVTSELHPFWVDTTSKLPGAVHGCPLNQIENGFQIRDQHGQIDRGNQ